MKLFEMRKLPYKAGNARLEFSELKTYFNDDRREIPVRDGDKIFLPGDREAEFYELKDGEQFLFRFSNRLNDVQYWFGGTDNVPFLVEIQRTAFDVYKEKGENDFFNALKPAAISHLEKLLNGQYSRQGDIFAIPLPFDWNQIRVINASWLKTYKEPVMVKDHQLLGTRHLLNGKIFVKGDMKTVPAMSNVVIVEGVIAAPDHPPLRLDRPHLIDQTACLCKPDQAD